MRSGRQQVLGRFRARRRSERHFACIAAASASGGSGAAACAAARVTAAGRRSGAPCSDRRAPARRRIADVIRELQQAHSLPTVSRVRERLADLEREHEAAAPSALPSAAGSAPGRTGGRTTSPSEASRGGARVDRRPPTDLPDRTSRSV